MPVPKVFGARRRQTSRSPSAYLLLDDFQPTIRRVEYDVDRELKALACCRLPHTDWMAKTLASARLKCRDGALFLFALAERHHTEQLSGQIAVRIQIQSTPKLGFRAIVFAF